MAGVHAADAEVGEVAAELVDEGVAAGDGMLTIAPGGANTAGHVLAEHPEDGRLETLVAVLGAVVEGLSEAGVLFQPLRVEPHLGDGRLAEGFVALAAGGGGILDDAVEGKAVTVVGDGVEVAEGVGEGAAILLDILGGPPRWGGWGRGGRWARGTGGGRGAGAPSPR